MSIPTVAVTIRLASILAGVPVAGARVHMKLDRNDIYQGIVISRDVYGITGLDGTLVLELFPNALVVDGGLGTTGSVYRVDIQPIGGKSFKGSAVIPNVDCFLDDNLVDVDPVGPGIFAGQARDAADEAIAAAAQAAAILSNTVDKTLLASITNPYNIGFKQSFVNAAARELLDRSRESILFTDIAGVDKTGATDSSQGIVNLNILAALRGAISVYVPDGAYMFTNATIDQRLVTLYGSGNAWHYERIADPTKVGVRFFPSANAIWVIRLKGGTTNRPNGSSQGAWAQGSALKNIVIADTARGAHRYGVIIDCAGTVMDGCTVQDFQINICMPAAANMNTFNNVASNGSTKAGWLISEWAAKSYMHPDVPDIPEIGSTLWLMRGCTVRQNEFGMVARDGVGVDCGGNVIESNRQSGMFFYRPAGNNLRGWDILAHIENNYDGYAGWLVDGNGDPLYTIQGNPAFLIGDDETYIPWDPTLMVGAQIAIDSEVRTGTGGPDTFTFRKGGIFCNSMYQRAIQAMSGTGFQFIGTNFGGSGDEDNLITFTPDCQNVAFISPLYKNDPKAIIPCLVANNGARLGTNGQYVMNIDGKQVFLVGANGGPVYWPDPIAGDPRNSDPRINHQYREFPVGSLTFPWRVASAIPFAYSAESNVGLKNGMGMDIWCSVKLTATAAVAIPDRAFMTGFLPFPALAAGLEVGQVTVSKLDGGGAVVSSMTSPLRMSDVNSLLSVMNVFPAFAIGDSFLLTAHVKYPAVAT